MIPYRRYLFLRLRMEGAKRLNTEFNHKKQLRGLQTLDSDVIYCSPREGRGYIPVHRLQKERGYILFDAGVYIPVICFLFILAIYDNN